MSWAAGGGEHTCLMPNCDALRGGADTEGRGTGVGSNDSLTTGDSAADTGREEAAAPSRMGEMSGRPGGT